MRLGAGGHSEMMLFWDGLDEVHRECMCTVTEDVPLSTGEFAGLLDPYTSLVYGGFYHNVFRVLFLLVRIILNAIAGTRQFLRMMDPSTKVEHSHSKAQLGNGIFSVCYNISSAWHGDVERGNESGDMGGTGGHGCVHHHLSWAMHTQTVCAACEFTAVWVLISVLLVNTLVFLLCNTAGRASLVSRRPLLFVVFPKLAAGVSMLHGLLFLNAHLAKRAFRRGDLSMWFIVVLSSTCPGMVPVFTRFLRRSKHRIWLEVPAAVFLILCSLLALRDKMLWMYWVSTVAIPAWDLSSYLHFFGLVNQFVSIFELEMFEFMRMLVVKFAARDAKWSVREMEMVPQYFGLVFRRLIKGGASKRSCPGPRAVVMLMSFTSDSLQHLLLSTQRQKAIESVRLDRRRLVGEMLDPNLASASLGRRFSALQACMRRWQEHIRAEEALLITDTIEVSSGGRLRQLSEKTRLLAMIQSQIADVVDEALGDPEQNLDEGTYSPEPSTDEEQQTITGSESEVDWLEARALATIGVA